MRMLRSLIWRQIRPRSLHTIFIGMEAAQQDIEGSQDKENECTGVVHDDVGREGEAAVTGEESASSMEKESEPSATSDSIYLDNGPVSKKADLSPPSKPRRLTRAERARQEALASFGGSDLASVTVKKRDLHEELRRDTELMKKGEDSENRVKRKTRLQAAREESNALFKDVPFGQKTVRKRKMVSEDTDCGSKPKVRRTRAERAKQDALNSFGGFGFDDVMATSRKRIARTFEMPKEKRGEGEGEAEEAEGEAGEGEGDGERNQEREEEKENLEVVAET